jgi:TRAP-type uncharacterized transport system fused permease subunit
MTSIINAFAVALTAAVLALAGDLPGYLGLQIYTEQYIAVLFGIALALVYLTCPACKPAAAGPATDEDPRRRMHDIPWYDVAAAALGFALCMYIAFRFPVLSEAISERPWDGLLTAGAV